MLINILAVIGGIGVIVLVIVVAMFIWAGIQKAQGKNPFQ